MSNFSNQTAVSDGTLVTLIVSIEFFSQGEISVALDNVPLVVGVDYNWTSATSTTIQFPLAIPNGGVVHLQRSTDIANMRHIFTAGAQFNNQSLDEDYEQILRIVQEFSEGANVSILNKTLRIPTAEPDIPTLPLAAARANQLLSFDVLGNPTTVAPASGSAVALAVDLADYLTVGRGAAMVGLKTIQGTPRTVADITGFTPTTGASLIGRNFQVVSSIAELKLLLKDSQSHHAFVTGFRTQGDGGGGPYSLRVGDNTSVEIPGILVVAADGGRWELTQSGSVSIKQFGAIAGVFDAPTQTINNAAFQAARDWIGTSAVSNRVVFPSGVYGYNVSPNWAIQDAVIQSEGEVRLRYFGTGNAVIIDHGPVLNTFLYNITMGTFIIEAPSTALNGVYIRSIHHSRLTFKVEGCGTAFSGILVEFAVCTDFSNCSCSPNENNAWYLGARPQYGIRMIQRNVGEQTSYCLTANGIFEGLAAAGGAGILLEGALGNVFQGGTSEGCDHGLITTAGSINNRFYGIDFEANATRDVLEQGQGQEFHGVDSALLVTVGAGALFPKFFGGSYEGVEIATGARWPVFHAININRFATVGGGFSNGEPTSVFRDCIDLQTQRITPQVQATIAVGASPFNYANLTGNDKQVSISGGTVTSIIMNRAGVDVTLPGLAGVFTLSPNDTIRVTYSGLPNMYYWQS